MYRRFGSEAKDAIFAPGSVHRRGEEIRRCALREVFCVERTTNAFAGSGDQLTTRVRPGSRDF
jgi:hypothetical protein